MADAQYTHLYRLTNREQQVMALVAEGLTNQQIAAALGVKERTIRTHLGNVYEKLDVPNRASAIAAVNRQGLLPPVALPLATLDALRVEAERARLHADRCLALIAQLRSA